MLDFRESLMPNANPEIIANPQRLERLRDLCLLDTPADPAFDRLTRLASRILHAPISLVTLVDANRQFFKSQVGLEDPWKSARQMPLDYSYCQHVVATQSPLVVEDSIDHPLLFDNLATLNEGVRSYAGIPLVTSDGDAIGSFCVADKVPRKWTDEELEILADLSESVMTEIELRSELIERHKTEDALRKKEQQLEAIISNSHVVFYVVNQDGIIQMTEGKGLEKLGLPPNRLVGQSIFNVYANNAEIVSAVKRTLSGRQDSIMVEQPSPLGPLDFEVFLSPFYDIDNNIIGAIGVATDVTDLMAVEKTLENTVMRLTLLRRIESELSESLDLNSVLTIAMDAAMRATNVENGFIGLIDGDQLRAVYTIGKYQPGFTIDSSVSVVGRAMRTYEPQLVLNVDEDMDYIEHIPSTRAQMAIPLIHRDHLIGAMNLETSKPQLFTHEAFDFLTLVAGQITIAIDNAQLYQVSQRQLEELHQLYMRVMELEQLKTDMIRIAAHDLRNPLGVITGFAQLMLEDELTDEQRTFITSIDGAAQKMQKIINDILSLQRIEASMDDKRCDEIDLVELVSEIFAGNKARAGEKSQDFTLDVPEARITVCVDTAQMREAIDNLIGNAIKYTPDGGKVSVRVTASGGAVFEVEDTGFGIPEDQQGRLFQPFFRASNAKASQIEGTGLGLHLVKNIIERQGGKMHFHSTLGKGSLFGFSLPQV